MNILPLIYPTAAEIWLESPAINPKNFNLVSLPDEFQLILDSAFLGDVLDYYKLKAPLKVLASDVHHRVDRKLAESRVRSAHLPPESFIKLNDSVYVASPELCFLQSAQVLTCAQMVKFGNNLCAGYVKDKNSEYGQTKRQPIASVESIKKFLDGAGKYPGIKKARHALKYVMNNSGSPMESNLAVFDVLPLHMGGYNLPRPVLNGEIKLPPDAASQLGCNVIHVDGLWEDFKVAMEYDSSLTHLSEEQHSLDKHRANALTMAGYTVIVITKDDMSDPNKMDAVFLMLIKALGMRHDTKRFEKYTQKRRNLLRELRSRCY